MKVSRIARNSRNIAAKRLLMAVTALMLVAFHSSSEPGLSGQGTDDSKQPVITVYKTPTCGCCTKWVDHLKENGFEAIVHEAADITSTKVENGVPSRLSSCHTALVDGYVIEGHVPAADIKRLLKERPDVVGLTAPGMPMGSPGMEMPSGHKAAYEVLTFDASGKTAVFSQH